MHHTLRNHPAIKFALVLKMGNHHFLGSMLNFRRVNVVKSKETERHLLKVERHLRNLCASISCFISSFRGTATSAKNPPIRTDMAHGFIKRCLLWECLGFFGEFFSWCTPKVAKRMWEI